MSFFRNCMKEFLQISIVHQSPEVLRTICQYFKIFNGFGFLKTYIFKFIAYTQKYNVYGCSADIRLIYRSLKKLQFDTTNVCRTSGSEIIFLEHTEVEANLKYSRRGALQMRLTAPSGIINLIFDFSISLFKIFSTCHC